MSSALLDQVFAATTVARPAVEIVSENHDPNRINFVVGLSDPGEMIRCGYLPQLRRHDGEQDAAYADRIRPLVMALSKKDRDRIMGAAIKRAGLDASNGRVSVMVAGTAAWHDLGVNVRAAVASGDAVQLAGLGWKVLKLPTTYVFDGDRYVDPDVYVLVRQDTGKKLANVGKLYEPIQNTDQFAFLDGVFAEFGARYETAGALYGGKKVWCQARFPEQAFNLNGNDEVMPYVTFVNAHGGEAAWVYPTEEREVCANTHRVSFGKNKDKGFSIRHTGDVQRKVRRARELLGLAVKGFDRYHEQAEVLAAKPLPNLRKYGTEVLDTVLGVTELEAEIKAGRKTAFEAAIEQTEAEQRLEKLTARRDSLLEEVLERHEAGHCYPVGSAWAAYNAVSETADHGSYSKFKRGDTDTRASRRFESVIAGDADELKQTAFNMALKV